MKIQDHAFAADLQNWISEHLSPYTPTSKAEKLVSIHSLVRELAQSNLLTRGWPAPYGDNDIRKQLYLHFSLARQALGAVGLCLASHIDIGARGLLDKGSPELIDKWLPKALTGDAIFSLAMTEPDAGSDLQGIQFTANKSEEGWILNGVKRGITNLPFADAALVLARTNASRSPFSYSLFLVPIETAGITREQAVPTLAYHGCLGGISAKDAVIPLENLVGPFGAGLMLLMKHLETERLFVSARMLGISTYLIEELIQHTRNTPQCALQADNVARLKMQLMALEAYFETCVNAFEEGELSAKDSAALKYMGSSLLKSASNTLADYSGAQGYLRGTPAIRFTTEAMGLALAGGSEEIMLSIIGNTL